MEAVEVVQVVWRLYGISGDGRGWWRLVGGGMAEGTVRVVEGVGGGGGPPYTVLGQP